MAKTVVEPSVIARWIKNGSERVVHLQQENEREYDIENTFFDRWKVSNFVEERRSLILISWGSFHISEPSSKHEEWKQLDILIVAYTIDKLFLSIPASKYNTKVHKVLLGVTGHIECDTVYGK